MNLTPPPIDISICIANFNGGEYVIQCIESALQQQTSAHFEIIVHDDASTDDSATTIATRFPDITLIRSEENTGFCISNNRMVDRARGRFLLLLNNDATLRAGSLEAFWQASAQANHDAILGLPQYTLVDGTLVDYGYVVDCFINPIALPRPANTDVAVATGACLWIPLTVWKKVGGFPAWFESIAEDIYLCMASRLLGHAVRVLPSPGFDHWIGRNLGGGKVIANQLKTTVRRRRLSERNKTFVMLLLYPAWLLWLLIPLHSLTLTAEALFLLLSGTHYRKVSDIYLHLPQRVLRELGHIRALRRHLQSQRRSSWAHFFATSRWFPAKLSALIKYRRPTLD